MFHDLVMAGLGVCDVSDIAISVLCTVIGHQADKGWVLVDAGWMAMSRDRGTAQQKIDYGYGAVCDLDGKWLPELHVSGANQEHGIISAMSGLPIDIARFPIGSQLRILPNHACATAAQFDRYHVVNGGLTEIATWPRWGGW
jgi:D-serine deaminase-like pyridoxal phosphate-dependent protein